MSLTGHHQVSNPFPLLKATVPLKPLPSPPLDNSDAAKEKMVMSDDENHQDCPEVTMRLAKLQELKASFNNSDDDFEPATSPPKKKRVRENITGKGSGKKPSRKKPTEKSYTIDKILDTWHDDTEYGKSFRGMTTEEQLMEVDRMNKGA